MTSERLYESHSSHRKDNIRKSGYSQQLESVHFCILKRRHPGGISVSFCLLPTFYFALLYLAHFSPVHPTWFVVPINSCNVAGDHSHGIVNSDICIAGLFISCFQTKVGRSVAALYRCYDYNMWLPKNNALFSLSCINRNDPSRNLASIFDLQNTSTTST